MWCWLIGHRFMKGFENFTGETVYVCTRCLTKRLAKKGLG